MCTQTPTLNNGGFRYAPAAERPTWLDGFYAFYNERFGDSVAGPIVSADEPPASKVPSAVPDKSEQPAVLEKGCEELHTPLDSATVDEPPSNRIGLPCEPPAGPTDDQHLPWAGAWLAGIGEHDGASLQGAEGEAGVATLAPSQFTAQNGGAPPTLEASARQELLGVSPSFLSPLPSSRTGFVAHFARHLGRLLSWRRRRKTKFVWLTLTAILLLTGPALELVRHSQLHGQTNFGPAERQPETRRLPEPRAVTGLADAPISQPVTLTAIRHASMPEMTTITIELSGPAKYQVNRLSHPDRIYIDFSNVRLLPAFDGKAFIVAKECLSRFRMAPRGPQATRVTFETGAFCDYSASLSSNPSRLLVGLRPGHPGR